MKIEIYDMALAWQKIQGFSPSKKKGLCPEIPWLLPWLLFGGGKLGMKSSASWWGWRNLYWGSIQVTRISCVGIDFSAPERRLVICDVTWGTQQDHCGWAIFWTIWSNIFKDSDNFIYFEIQKKFATKNKVNMEPFLVQQIASTWLEVREVSDDLGVHVYIKESNPVFFWGHDDFIFYKYICFKLIYIYYLYHIFSWWFFFIITNPLLWYMCIYTHYYLPFSMTTWTHPHSHSLDIVSLRFWATRPLWVVLAT